MRQRPNPQHVRELTALYFATIEFRMRHERFMELAINTDGDLDPELRQAGLQVGRQHFALLELLGERSVQYGISLCDAIGVNQDIN